MRTTLTLDDDLVLQAQTYAGLKEKSALVREALKALIERSGTPARSPRRQRPDRHSRTAPPSCMSDVLVDTGIWIDHLRSGDATAWKAAARRARAGSFDGYRQNRAR